ncbi:MAG TPA: GH116 family glycosyl hydrolase [Pseudothermotoga sp.]
MEYRILDNGTILYEKALETFILSNLEQTLIMKYGEPKQLFSSKHGLVLEFVKTNIGEPVLSGYWPNGCNFQKEDMNWSFLTANNIVSTLFFINGLKRLELFFKVPLKRNFKVPFFKSIDFEKPLTVSFSDGLVNFSDLLKIKIVEGKLIKFEQKNDRIFEFVVESNDKGFIKLSFGSQISVDGSEEDQNRVYLKKLNEHCPGALNNLEKALYFFSVHTALSCWKDFGTVKALSAGNNYSFPPRTYFRDGFWTALTLLKIDSKLVKEQILALAQGIHDDNCPSAVMFLNNDEKRLLRDLVMSSSQLAQFVRYENDWWSNHHDSGPLFVLLVFEYIKFTEDLSILSEEVDGKTILEKIKIIIRQIDSYPKNKDGLMLKPYDSNDWADNVFRNGLVSYDLALQIAALGKACEIFKMHGTKVDEFCKKFNIMKKLFNQRLFDHKKGYFYDFVGTYVEDHLSLDTIVAILYDIADKDKALSTLSKMHDLLETRNNSEQPYGDWGVMNVWPPYKKRSHLFGKSAFPFRYHNSSCWPYLNCAYALAQFKNGFDPSYGLLEWWKYSLKHGWLNLVEYYSPAYHRGGLNQGWSSFAGFVIDEIYKK